MNENLKETDHWYLFCGAIEEFNEICATKLVCSQWIVADESMSAWRPRTTPEEVLTLQKSVISDLSSLSLNRSTTVMNKLPVQSLQDAKGKRPYLLKFDVTKDLSGHSRTKK